MRTVRKTLFTILFVIGMLTALSKKQALAFTVTGSTGSVIVSFDANGGESGAADMVVSYGEPYGELPEATRENYVFQGWYTFRSGGSKVTTEMKLIKNSHHTLYARWRGEQHEITLDLGGGTLNSDKKTKVTSEGTQTTAVGAQDTDDEAQDPTTVKVYFGSKYLKHLPTPTKDNYVFEGWYTEASEGKKISYNSIFNEKSEKTLYAHWIERQVKVVFIAFNGESYEKYVSYGKAYGELPEPVREGYTLDGWYRRKDYTNYKAEPITADTEVKDIGHVDLLAKWNIGNTNSE